MLAAQHTQPDHVMLYAYSGISAHLQGLQERWEAQLVAEHVFLRPVQGIQASRRDLLQRSCLRLLYMSQIQGSASAYQVACATELAMRSASAPSDEHRHMLCRACGVKALASSSTRIQQSMYPLLHLASLKSLHPTHLTSWLQILAGFLLA